MEDNDMNEDFSKKMEEVLQQIEIREKSTVLNFVQELNTIKEQKIQLEASQIYADKELEATEEDGSNKDQKKDKVAISNEIYELHSGLNNHRLIHNLAQKIMDNCKIQDAVFSSLNSMDVDETVDHFPERGELLSQYSQNMDVSKKLVEVIDQKTQLEKDIVNHRVKYCNLLKQIKEKWILLEEKSTGVYKGDNDNPEMKKFRDKIDDRTNKLRILAVMLQCLITCTGINWGSNQRLLQTLILCDSAMSLSKQKNIKDEIKTLEELRAKGSDNPRTSRSPTKQSQDDSRIDKQARLSDYFSKKGSK